MLVKHLALVTSVVALAAASILPKDNAVIHRAPISHRPGPKPYPHPKKPRKPCKHGPKSRDCWGKYSLDTNYYEEVPDTGVTREYWFNVQNTTLAPDGYVQWLMTVNGTFPGPAIYADWGDTVIVHVKNELSWNGTAIHWHGVRQLNTSEHDGVPGVTQCPIAPGDTFTYKWRAVQYGTSWWHSHYSIQYSVGLFGAIIINGPATADYDEDLGVLYMQDWNHIDPWNEWWWMRSLNDGPPPQAAALINGTNVFDCTGLDPTRCLGTGKRFEMVFQPGKKYRLRLINPGLYSHFRFAIDGHKMKVISNDFVPIVPYETDSILVNMGQRHDVIIEANAKPGNYWLRPIWQRVCSDNEMWNNTLGIVRYNKHSTALPTTTNPAVNLPDDCNDEPFDKLVPYMDLDVPAPLNIPEPLMINYSFVPPPAGFIFSLNNSYIWVNFSQPTNLMVKDGFTEFPKKTFPYDRTTYFTSYNTAPLTVTDEWIYYNLGDISNRNRSHPMHLHGHDFYVLAQGEGLWNPSKPLKLKNPPRRDTATVPINGHMVIAFRTDNPGSWIFHCHIASHIAQGLGLEFIERPSEIAKSFTEEPKIRDMCTKWIDYWNHHSPYIQQDSGV